METFLQGHGVHFTLNSELGAKVLSNDPEEDESGKPHLFLL